MFRYLHEHLLSNHKPIQVAQVNQDPRIFKWHVASLEHLLQQPQRKIKCQSHYVILAYSCESVHQTEAVASFLVSHTDSRVPLYELEITHLLELGEVYISVNTMHSRLPYREAVMYGERTVNICRSYGHDNLQSFLVQELPDDVDRTLCEKFREYAQSVGAGYSIPKPLERRAYAWIGDVPVNYVKRSDEWTKKVELLASH